MSSLTFSEKRHLEKILDMSTGYVLDFSDRTFGDFVFEYTSLDIHDEKYQSIGNSKAKKLRAFWDLESDIIVCNLLFGFVEYIDNDNDKKNISQIACRLKSNSNIEDHIGLIEGKTEVFNLLKSEIIGHINEDKYIESLDRIHTLFHAYLLEICYKLGLQCNKDELVNSLLGKVKRSLLDKNVIMIGSFTEKTISKIIQILETYNNVRNNQSLAHSNEVLSYNDAKFAVNMISLCLSYIDPIIRGKN